MTDREELDVEVVKDVLALEYVNPKNSAKTKEVIARLTYRLFSGLIPFPSQTKIVAEGLQSRGERLEQELHDKITEAINRGVSDGG